MKDLFWEYYHPTKNELEKMRDEGVYVFDACSLLKIYSFPIRKRNLVLKFMMDLSKQNRVWLTNEHCREYHSSRLNRIEQEYRCYDESIDKLKQHAKTDFFKLNVGFTDHYKLDPKKICKRISNDIKNIVSDLVSTVEEQKSCHPDYREKDPIRNKIEKIFKDKIGQPYTEEKLLEKLEEARKRKISNRKPGTSDTSHGDTLAWFQIIDFAQMSKNDSIILITEETKKDFFSSKKLSGNTPPAPEMIKEMHDQTGKLFFIFSIEDIIPTKEKKYKMEVESVRSDRIDDESLTNPPVIEGSSEEPLSSPVRADL